MKDTDAPTDGFSGRHSQESARSPPRPPEAGARSDGQDEAREAPALDASRNTQRGIDAAYSEAGVGG